MSRKPASEDEPGTGEPVRNRFAADPSAVTDWHAMGPDGVRALTRGRPGARQGSGDARPPVVRPGSQHGDMLPSRVGNYLQWPDGRRTGLDGVVWVQP